MGLIKLIVCVAALFILKDYCDTRNIVYNYYDMIVFAILGAGWIAHSSAAPSNRIVIRERRKD